MPYKKKYGSEKKEEWHKKLGLSRKMDTNMVHRYSNLREKLLRITYNDLGVKLTGTLQACDGCTRPKEKERAVRKKTYTRASHPGERIFVDKTGPFPESLIGNRYWIGVVYNYSRYY